MKRRRFLPCAGLALGAVWLAPFRVLGQWDTLLESGRQWLEKVADPEVLRALRSGDRRQLEPLLQEMMQSLQDDEVLDLARLREAAQLALPLLEGQAQTRGYGAWLRARMDYFQVAEQLRKRAPAPPAPPGQPSVTPPNPTPSQERQAWEKQVASQPAPRGAATWVPRLKPLFKAAGAPPQLVWLAEIESSFDPQARSPAGAAGLYQLMPRTAEGLGLKLQPQDERLVPEKSARAAGGYLRQMYQQFRDWPLALAAYNAGPGRVADLLKRRRATSYDAVAPVLPAETQMYVPKFEAVLKQRENLALRSLRLPARPA